MRRGEIRIVNLSPTLGAEAAQSRPAVIVSNDGANTTAARLGHEWSPWSPSPPTSSGSTPSKC